MSIRAHLHQALLVTWSVVAAFGVRPSAVAAADVSVDQGTRLEEIIVTAQKRTENLQDVPTSVQVVVGEVLQQQNFNDLQELSQTVPDVHISSGHGNNDMYIRGVGAGGENPTFEQSVATFVDDIYLGRARLSGATFLDVDRIEVLKGPQSTFFGNNAIAGALNIVTNKPGKEFEATARALYGMFGQYAVEGAVSVPITDTFAARLAVTRNGDDRGWLDNVDTGDEIPHINNGAVRLTLVYKPIENLDATLKTEASEHRTSGSYFDLPPQWVNCPPPPPLTAAQIDNTLGTHCGQALALGPSKVPIGLNSNLTAGPPGQFNSLSTFEEELTINYRQWDHIFTSVSGYYNFHFKFNGDLFELPTPMFTNYNPESYHQFSQEFRVTSPSGRTLEYLAGIYYQTDRLETDGETNLIAFGNLGAPVFDPYVPLGAQQLYVQDEHVYSVFGSLTWNVTDRLKLNGGLRASWVDKNVNQSLVWGTGTQTYGGFVPTMPLDVQQLLTGFAGPPGAHFASVSNNAVMPSASIQYKLYPETMAYFSYTRGFLAGGVDFQEDTKSGALNPYQPEYVNAYELGLKSKWFDDRALLNIDVFRSDYSNLQDVTSVITALGRFPKVTNAATSRSQGVELEGQWVVSDEFRIGANATYLDSYYISYPDGPATSTQTLAGGGPFQDHSGDPTPYAPKWSGSVNARYITHLPGGYKFTTQASPYFTSGFYSVSGDPFYYIRGYTRLDARLSLESPDNHWGVDLIGKNLTNRVIINATSFSITQASKEQPRNVAVQFRYKW